MVWSTVEAGPFKFNTLELGSGSPLVYLHGVEGHPGEAPFLTRLAESHRVIAPELVGYGDSTGFEHIDDVLDMTLAVRQCVEKVAGGPFDLVGHSLGGMFAAELAAVTPQLVRKLVLVGPFGLWLEDNPIPDFFTLNPQKLAEITWAAEGNAATAVLNRELANGADPIVKALSRSTNLAIAGKFLWPIPDRGLRKRLPLISAPTLVLTGDADKLIPPAYGKAFANAIPGATAETISGAGHYPMVEQEDAFVSRVNGFLS